MIFVVLIILILAIAYTFTHLFFEYRLELRRKEWQQNKKRTQSSKKS